MTDVGREHHESPKGTGGAPTHPSPIAAIFTVVLLSGLGAAGAAYGLGDLLGLGVGAVIAVAGAVVASFVATKTAPPDVKAIAFLEAVTAENAPVTPPSRFRSEPWASLYAQAVGNAEAQKTATLAVQEVESLRRQLEEKGVTPAAFVPRPSHDHAHLVGAAAEEHGDAGDASDANPPYGSRPAYAAPDSRPSYAASDESPSYAAPAVSAEPAYDRAAALRELEAALHPIRDELAAIERDLAPVVASLQTNAPGAAPSRDSSAAKMVDALVQTAADGIEDLAAGLMRASELAGVAERVTNRATLLALNAALEATRSGSEAFASIAEETRRLAEYAREATDTITRLSGEIEMKVGETISAIQSSSEDAKAAVQSMGPASNAPTRGVAPETATALQALLVRVRTLHERTVAGAPNANTSDEATVGFAEGAGTAASTYMSFPAASDAPNDGEADVEVAYVDADARAVTPLAAPHDGPHDAHNAFGSVAFGGGEHAPVSATPDAPVSDAVDADASADADAPADTAAPADGSTPADSPAPHATADPASLVLPKIPDWLEGIEPRHRS